MFGPQTSAIYYFSPKIDLHILLKSQVTLFFLIYMSLKIRSTFLMTKEKNSNTLLKIWLGVECLNENICPIFFLTRLSTVRYC